MNGITRRVMHFLSIFLAATAILSTSVAAQKEMSFGAGFDLLFPVGEFAKHWGTGYGATAEFDYAFTEHASVTGKIGYLGWSWKNADPGVTGSYGGVPILAGLKYYPRFLPKGGPVRVYGHLELGIMAGSLTVHGYNGSLPQGSGLTIAPSAGLEFPVTSAGKVDLSIRIFDISRKGSVGLRAGYIFELKPK